jgi:hypothetical protein
MRTATILSVAIVATAALALSVAAASAQNYRRPADTAVTPAPSFAPSHAPGDPRSARQQPSSRPVAAWNGMEGPAYGYGYAANLPADGNWRWIDPRCYDSSQGRVCVDGHWIRRGQSGCEEVSSHQVRRGNYVRIVPAGQVASCRR